jgi:transcription antitermination factor NusG
MMLMAVEKNENKINVIDGAACPWPRQPRVGARKGAAWYLLQINSGAETKVTDFLKPFGYEVYYPKTLVLKAVPKRELTPSQRGSGVVIRRPYLLPIFPGYPYIHFDMEDGNIHDLFKFTGVYGVHCAGEKPVIVDDAYVWHLKNLEEPQKAGIISANRTLRELFGVGDSVLINNRNSPFRGFTGVIETLPPKLQQQIDQNKLSELDESMCATIAIHLFGGLARATIPLGSIEKLS